jgi:hypothetical protein
MRKHTMLIVAGAALSALVFLPKFAAADGIRGAEHHHTAAKHHAALGYCGRRPLGLGFSAYGASDYYNTYYPYPGYDSYYPGYESVAPYPFYGQYYPGCRRYIRYGGCGVAERSC